MDTHPADTGQSPDRETAGNGPRSFPLVVRVAGAPCLVVGAGPVAARKAQSLIDAGALVTIVAPDIGDEVRALVAAVPSGGELTVHARSYAPTEAADYLLVVSATGDSEVDARVTSDALAGRALVNRADTAIGAVDGSVSGGTLQRAAPGTVVLPAVHRAGPVTVAVSTDGSSPALARWLRDRIAVVVGPDIAMLATLVGERRQAVLEAGGTVDASDWPGVFDDLIPLIADGRLAEARELLASRTVAAVQAPHHRDPQPS